MLMKTYTFESDNLKCRSWNWGLIRFVAACCLSNGESRPWSDTNSVRILSKHFNRPFTWLQFCNLKCEKLHDLPCESFNHLAKRSHISKTNLLAFKRHMKSCEVICSEIENPCYASHRSSDFWFQICYKYHVRKGFSRSHFLRVYTKAFRVWHSETLWTTLLNL